MGLPSLVRSSAADVVHVHHPNLLGDIAALADRRRPLVITQHSDIVRQRALRLLYGPFLSAALRRARFVVAASEQFLGWSPELRPFLRKARVIPYGIDAARFAATPEVVSRAAVLRAGWPEGGVVLSVGRLVGYKGHDVLLEAARRLDATVVIVGTGPEAARLRSLAGPRTVLAGAVAEADLPSYYHAADVFCLPSVTVAEAFGMVLLEAMACGVPLVTTTLPTGVSAVNRDGTTGLVVPPGDAGALAEALAALLGDAARRAALGRAGRRVLEEEYTAALMGERYLSLYREALA
jgi:rhamnosyl/mannosyltransferase